MCIKQLQNAIHAFKLIAIVLTATLLCSCKKSNSNPIGPAANVEVQVNHLNGSVYLYQRTNNYKKFDDGDFNGNPGTGTQIDFNLSLYAFDTIRIYFSNSGYPDTNKIITCKIIQDTTVVIDISEAYHLLPSANKDGRQITYVVL